VGRSEAGNRDRSQAEENNLGECDVV